MIEIGKRNGDAIAEWNSSDEFGVFQIPALGQLELQLVRYVEGKPVPIICVAIPQADVEVTAIMAVVRRLVPRA